MQLAKLLAKVELKENKFSTLGAYSKTTSWTPKRQTIKAP